MYVNTSRPQSPDRGSERSGVQRYIKMYNIPNHKVLNEGLRRGVPSGGISISDPVLLLRADTTAWIFKTVDYPFTPDNERRAAGATQAEMV